MLAPLVQNQTGEFRDVIEKVKREALSACAWMARSSNLGGPEPIRLKKTSRHTIEAVVDRLVIREGIARGWRTRSKPR